jgi:hypothetical protein
MNIQPRYLIVALIVFWTCLHAGSSRTALSQDTNWVIIRATVPQPRRGRIPARVIVSKKRVRVGEWVMVELAHPAGVSRAPIRVSFGDGREEVTRNRQIDHKYGKVGHYDITAWIESEGSTAPAVPRVFLTVAPNSTGVESLITFKTQLANDYPELKYRFVFGDGKQTDWQDTPTTTHAYLTARTYQAYVDIGVQDKGSIKQIGGSPREPVQIRPQPSDSVILDADPTTAETGQRVTLSARSRSKDSKLSYRFVFGDGSSTGWQTSSQATHEYSSPNTYMAFVEIKSNNPTFNSPTITSARKPIRVITSERLRVDLKVDPAAGNTETMVTFTARTNSREANVRYRFFYGDGSSSDWQAGPRSRHKYSGANTYFAYVEVANNRQGSNAGAKSKSITLTITSVVGPTPTPTPATPTPTPASSPGGSPSPSPGGSPVSSPSSSPAPSPVGSPSSSREGSPGGSPGSSPGPPRSVTDSSPSSQDPGTVDGKWWIFLIILLLISFAGYRLYKFLFAPRPTFSPVLDAGGASVDEASTPLAINSQILLSPDIADGLYRVNTEEPNLIKSIRSEND